MACHAPTSPSILKRFSSPPSSPGLAGKITSPSLKFVLEVPYYNGPDAEIQKNYTFILMETNTGKGTEYQLKTDTEPFSLDISERSVIPKDEPGYITTVKNVGQIEIKRIPEFKKILEDEAKASFAVWQGKGEGWTRASWVLAVLAKLLKEKFDVKEKTEGDFKPRTMLKHGRVDS